MPTKSFQDFIKNRNPSILNSAWHNAKLGDILPEEDIYIFAQAIHRTDEDWEDGDIGHRIERFSKWFSDETGRSLDEYNRDLFGGTAVVLGHLSYAYIKTSTRLA